MCRLKVARKKKYDCNLCGTDEQAAINGKSDTSNAENVISHLFMFDVRLSIALFY